MIPRRPSPADAKALDAVRRYRVALDRHHALAASIQDRADRDLPANLDSAGPMAQADHELHRAGKALRLHLDREALVHAGVAYMLDGRGGIATVAVRVLDGRVAARLPGLGVSP